MTRRRWIADEFSRDRASLTGAHAAHLSRTLRARVGQQFEIACGDTVRQGTITSVTGDRVEFALAGEISAAGVVPITLLLAIFKFDRMEWAIEKCTELNVTQIVPVVARRTEKHLAQAAGKRLERWRRLARQASEQSRRLAPPEIAVPMKLSAALAAHRSSNNADAQVRNRLGEESPLSVSASFARQREPRSGGHDVSPGRKPWVDASSNNVSPVGTAHAGNEDFILGPPDLRIVLAETERTVMLADILRANTPPSLTLAIGPEGGWTPDELLTFAAAHFLSCSLGDTILRAETAAIAAVAIAQAEM